MVAKYRPAVPVMTLVVPYLKVRGWVHPGSTAHAAHLCCAASLEGCILGVPARTCV